jgi:cysteine desulfurase
MNSFKNAEIVTSPIEHPSVIEPAKKYPHKFCLVGSDGLIDLKSLEKSIGSSTALVSIALVNHEIGTIQPIKQISDLISKIKAERKKKGNKLSLYLHTDACQATNYLDQHVSRLGVDLMTVNGAKIYGPKQSGLLFIKTGVVINPLIAGGGQERGLRSGTENVANAIGLAKALEITNKLRKTEIKRLENLRDQFISGLIKIRPDIKINGSLSRRVANNIHLTIPRVDNEWLLIKLDQAGIEAAAGSACTASNQTPSDVLKAVGLDEKSARESIRFTLGRQTKMSDIKKCLSVLSKLIN